MGNELKGSEFIEKGYLDNAIKETREYVELLKKADEELKSIAKTTQLGKGGLSAKGISQATTAYNTLNETRKKSILVDKEKAKAIKQLTDLEDEQVKGRLRFQRANKEQRDALKAEIVLNDQLAGTEEKLLAQNRLLRLERKKLIKGTKDYDRELKRINRTIDENNRKTREGADLDKKRLLNIGNYKTALKGLASQIGLTFGIAGAFRFVRESVTVLADFEASMQTLAGVFRTTRDELAPVEAEIRKVGASSVRTSLQTSMLAESLATLGKTKEEIVSLLQPVTNLSIGLQASSADAGEFLVQTLNAFGAGSDEAEKYADVIASIRTSTSLDFQKMRDSFQYITPISKLLNKDLAYTGSLVGILADNGLKAESAGRLLGTAIQRLATQNITLEEALEKINKARAEGIEGTELMALATEMLGVQSAKIGIILANNSEIIETNAQAIRDNTGALDDLVNSQLNSLTAQLSILKSAFQDYLLELDETYNITENLTKVVKFLSENLSSIFRVIKVAVVAFTSFKAVIILMNAVTLVLNTTIKGVTVSIKAMNTAMKRNVIGVVITLIATLVATFLEYTNEVDENTKAIEANRKEQEKLNAELREQQSLLDDIEFRAENGISLNNDSTESLKKLQEQYKANIRDTEALKELYGANDKQLKQSGKAFDDYYVSLIKGTEINSEGEQALIRRANALRNLSKVEKELAKRGAGGSVDPEKTGLSQLQKDIIENQKENIATRKANQEKADEEEYLSYIELLKRKREALRLGQVVISDIQKKAMDEEFKRIDDLIALEAERSRRRIEQEKEEKQRRIKNAIEVSNFIAQETDRRIQLRQDEIRQGQDRINALTSIQTANSAQSIVALEKANANKEKEIEKLERRKRNLLISVVALERAGQLIGQGDTAPLANAGKGIADLLSNLPKFFKGTDKRVGDEMTKVRNTGKDDYLALVDRNEMIFTGNKVDSMAKVGLNTTDKITASAIAYQTQIANGRAMRTSSSKTMSDARIVSELGQVKKAIDNIKIETTLLDPAFKRALVTGKGFTKIENYDNSEEI